ncbi:hypothetical protein COO91_01268 [Nostoc flagelliforme CCNUN1]|uniref:Uncharacterized protein n=1 Tax=Nostoc flagelliforme CCNUN1 TaxID=2038116 RepID=A0A2K8SJ73_9NOSO|nr:hypothetical protein [Nostoc flagelliforme]AUB35390.1 hypothetical protein COO91_01268 [Nostoc flagelliforme CCNUN1]
MNTNVVMSLGTTCAISWLVAYIGIIWRGFKDKSFGVPVTAISANISWEFIYAFVYEPFGDYLHVLTIPWLILDIPIAVQCFLYGPKDFDSPFIKKYFRILFPLAIAIAFPLVLMGFYEFHDPAGEYTGFGLNFMMSLLFIAMLLRRDSIYGQSIYIAISKWIATLFAYLATAVEALTNFEHPFPNFQTFIPDVISHQTYPLTPMINFMYLVTFFADILYIVLLYQKIKGMNINPWTRF